MALNSPSAFANIKAIFFDTADTLYSSETMEAEYPRKLSELVVSSRGVSQAEADALLKAAKQNLEKTTTEHITKVRIMAELGFTRAWVHEAFCTVNPKDFLSSDPALVAVMVQLAQAYKLGVISNFKASHVKEILEALGLSLDWFPILVTEDVVTEIKPNPEPFFKAIELADCKPEACLYVGDSPTKDMKPAKGVGMQTVLVDRKSEAERTAYADATISDVRQLVDLLDTH